MGNDDILWRNIAALQRERRQPLAAPLSPAARRRPGAKPAPATGAARREQASQPAKVVAARPAPRQASTLARYPARTIEEIRRAVKTIGKEVAFARVTPAEERQLADTVYTLRRRGLKTTENEVVRIALSYLLADHREQGKESVLERVLGALHA